MWNIWGLPAHSMSCCSIPLYCLPVAEDTTGPLINMPGGEFPTMHLSMLSVMGIWVVSGFLPSSRCSGDCRGACFPEATSKGFLWICTQERKDHVMWPVDGQCCDSRQPVCQSGCGVEMLCVPTTSSTFG